MDTLAKLRYSIFSLSLGGLGLSLYQMLHKAGFTESEFCNIDATFNCDIVNQGPYSEIFGIPVALIGVIGYGFLVLAAALKLRQPEDQTLSTFLLAASAGGFLFALYLTGIEAFVLQAWCILCLTSQVLIAGLLVLSFIHYKKERV